MSLEDIISKTIKDNNNPIGFDVFMNLALYHHQFGYYRSNKMIFGHKGDFITAPETSDLFTLPGETKAKKIGRFWCCNKVSFMAKYRFI